MNKADTPGPAVILLSGGLDSMVTAAIARDPLAFPQLGYALPETRNN